MYLEHPIGTFGFVSDVTSSRIKAPSKATWRPILTWTYDSLCEDARTRVGQITPEELEALRDESPSMVLLDVREQAEYETACIPGAMQLSRGILEKHIAEIVPDQEIPVVLYCQTGKRGILAADVLQRMGYARPLNLDGGIERWVAEGREISSDPPAVDWLETAPGPTGSAVSEQLDYSDWNAIRNDFPITRQTVSVGGGATQPLVYMDHAATTHPPGTVLVEYMNFLSNEYANVHRATYRLARNCTDRFEQAYRTCARFIGAELESGCIVFTSNTTNACDIVAHAMKDRQGAVIVTDLEHHSNDLPFRRHGQVLRAGLTDEGRLDMEHVRRLLQDNDIKLIAVTGAANVTGWMPDIHALARMAHDAGALICVDAAQLMAHAPIDVGSPGSPDHIDFLTAAGHKMYAPFGTGFLYGPRDILDRADPYVPGGGTAVNVTTDEVVSLASPDRHQPGTPNIAGVVGMASMLEYLMRIGMDRVRAHELDLLEHAWSGLLAIDGVILYGPQSPQERVGIIPLNIRGVNDMLAAAILGEEAGIAVRNGRFCSHIHTGKLVGPDQEAPQEQEVTGAVRASIGLFNTINEIDRLVDFCRRIRDGKWAGSYKVTANDATVQWDGRCADRWMESESVPG